MRDQYHDRETRVVIAAASFSADQAGTVVDTLGFNAVTFDLAIGAGGITFSGTNKIEFKLEASDDDSTYAAVSADDVVGVTVASGGVVKALTSAHASADVTSFGYIGDKRYLKLTADFSGTHGAATPISATASLGLPASAPAV